MNLLYFFLLNVMVATSMPAGPPHDEERNVDKDPVDGEWSSWERWAECSQSCGGGVQRRKRFCTNPSPLNGGKYCPGDQFDRRKCNMEECDMEGCLQEDNIDYSGSDIDPHFCHSCRPTVPDAAGCNRLCVENDACTHWTFNQLSYKCYLKNSDSGREHYSNAISGPKCTRGSKVKMVLDTVDGEWSSWETWTSCSQSCGGEGVQRRERSCTNPAPKNGGRYCPGDQYDRRNCNTEQCEIDGGWSSWETWTLCSQSCGGAGVQRRERSCTNPTPQNGGRHCPGDQFDRKICMGRCEIHGGWSSWTSCSKSCGSGVRTRTCTNPAPEHGGSKCSGPSEEKCKTQPCPVDGNWSSWGSCSKSCGSGVQTRSCTNPAPAHGGAQCAGSSEEQCNTQECPGCQGEYEYEVQYTGNDIECTSRDTPEQCQEFCKTFSNCAGWEWGFDVDQCCAKTELRNKVDLLEVYWWQGGRVAGTRNACIQSKGPISIAADLVLQSTGDVAEYQGGTLGLYRLAAGRHNGKVYYQQLDGVTEGQYLYWSNKWNNWSVGQELDGTAALYSNQDTDQPPSQGWQYHTGTKGSTSGWVDVDPSFSLSRWSSSSSLLPAVVTVVSASADVAGTYEFYDYTFSAGRPVYKKRGGEGGERFLMIRNARTNWGIRTELGGGTVLAHSGRATLSPTQAEAGPSILYNQAGWQIKQGGKWVEDKTFTVYK